jgi:hypothetical protein
MTLKDAMCRCAESYMTLKDAMCKCAEGHMTLKDAMCNLQKLKSGLESQTLSPISNSWPEFKL